MTLGSSILQVPEGLAHNSFFVLALLRYDSHAIHLNTHLKYTIDWFLVCSELHNHHCNQF